MTGGEASQDSPFGLDASAAESARVKNPLQILAMLCVNAVPALGWFVGGWDAGTLLVIYWFENVVATLFIGTRIFIHRRLAPCRGHFEYLARQDARGGRRGTFLSGYMTLTLFFSGAHGIFLAAIILLLTHNGHGDEIGLDWHEVMRGCGSVLLFLTLSLAFDLPGLRKKTFFWIEQMADRHLGRVVIVHLSIVFGMLAIAMTNVPKAFFGVFVGFKTLNDLATVLPPWNPEVPPRWLCRVMDMVPNASGKGRKDETFAGFWKRDHAAEIERRRRNEAAFVKG